MENNFECEFKTRCEEHGVVSAECDFVNEPRGTKFNGAKRNNAPNVPQGFKPEFASQQVLASSP